MHYALSMKMCLSVQKRLCLNLSPYSIFFFLVSRLPKRFCWTRSSHVQEIFFKIFVKISQKLFTRLCSKIFAPICFERPFRQPWTEYSHLPGKSHLNLSSTKQRATCRNDIIMQAPGSTPKDTTTQIPNLEQMHRQNICVHLTNVFSFFMILPES